MSKEIVLVGMAELKIGKAPGQISSLGLGSCIGICAYYPPFKVGGISHIMLPSSKMVIDGPIKPEKFADTAVPLLVSEMEKLGANKNLLIIKIVGGAEMFLLHGQDDHLRIGIKNISAVEEACEELGLKIVAKSVGGNSGKSVILDLDSGDLRVRTLSESVLL